MGNNRAYSDFETIAMGLEAIGALTLPVLDVIGSHYFGTYSDIDSGGEQGFTTADGRNIEQLVVNMLKPEYKPKPDSSYGDGQVEDCISWYYAFANLTNTRWANKSENYLWEFI